MKAIIHLAIAFLFAATSTAQTSNYVNITGGNPKADKLYSKISNELVLRAGMPATWAVTDNGYVIIRGDTLLLIPMKTGPVEVTINTAKGKEKLHFEAISFPEIELVLDGHPHNRIKISGFAAGQKFMVQAIPPDGFLEGYFIESFYATIGKSNMQNIGAIPDAKLAEAIKKAPVGSVLYISGLMLVNTKNGRRQTHNSNREFVFTID